MASFPTTLPAPLLRGYGLAPQAQTIRTEMEVGAPRVRRRSAARLDQLDVGWVFDQTQMAAFRTWFDDSAEAAGGAGWFTVTIDIGTGGSVSAEARFVDSWQAALADHGLWRVSAKLEVR